MSMNPGVLAPPRFQSIRDLLEAIRVKQWIKNLVVPLVAIAMLDLDSAAHGSAIQIFLAFAAFCVAASSVYILNDLLDLPKDRLHPTKCKRPIASGRISAPFLCGVLAAAVPAALFMGFMANPRVMVLLAIYLLINVGYCLRLKHVAQVDIVCVGSGFTLRALAGAYAAGTVVNFWVLSAVTFSCMGLAVMKRMKELRTLGPSGATRPVLAKYSYDTLVRAHDVFVMLSVQSLVMFIEQSSSRFGNQITVAVCLLFVCCAFLVFMQRVTSDEEGDPTALIYRYKFTVLLLVLGYVAIFLFK